MALYRCTQNVQSGNSEAVLAKGVLVFSGTSGTVTIDADDYNNNFYLVGMSRVYSNSHSYSFSSTGTGTLTEMTTSGGDITQRTESHIWHFKGDGTVTATLNTTDPNVRGGAFLVIQVPNEYSNLTVTKTANRSANTETLDAGDFNNDFLVVVVQATYNSNCTASITGATGVKVNMLWNLPGIGVSSINSNIAVFHVKGSGTATVNYSNTDTSYYGSNVYKIY